MILYRLELRVDPAGENSIRGPCAFARYIVGVGRLSFWKGAGVRDRGCFEEGFTDLLLSQVFRFCGSSPGLKRRRLFAALTPRP